MSEEATTAQVEQPAETPVEPASTEQATDPASPPDVGDALAQLNQRLSGIEEAVSQREPDPTDAWEALTQPVYEEEQPASQAEQPAPPDEQEQLVNEFNALVDARVQQMVAPHFEAQAKQARAEGIRALANEYPDFMDHAREIGQEMQTLADEYRIPAMAEDPRLARRLYQAKKAEAAAEAETPAEAVSQGATLETGAGPGNGETEESYEQKWLNTVFGNQGAAKDVFT